jgi:nucleoside-diphosphate-sugar epimerase
LPRDIVTGHLLAMERGRCGQRYIFSTEFVTVDTLMQWLEEITGRPRPRLRLPPGLMAAIAAVASPVLSAIAPNRPQRLTPGAVHLLRMHRRADCTKAKQELGYEPTSVKAAVIEAYRWFVAQSEIKDVRAHVATSPRKA